MNKAVSVVAAMLLSIVSMAQTINVHKTNGDVIRIPLSEMHYIDFSEDNTMIAPPAGVEIVDLGLPSGTKWANMNVGASNPEDFGYFYAWGETEEKGMYNKGTYIDNVNRSKDADLTFTEYDVAHLYWGGLWHMATIEQWRELEANCNMKWIQINDVSGYKFISKINNKSIFLPAAGCKKNVSHVYSGAIGYYWSSDLRRISYGISFSKEHLWLGSIDWGDEFQVYGCSVRPVQ